MDVLVTGGGGFIGSHLVALLVKRGERCACWSGPAPPSVTCRWTKSKWCAPTSATATPSRRRCAAARSSITWRPTRTCGTHRRGQFTQVNYRGTVHVLDAALEAGAARVLHTSTESILTRAAAGRPHPRGPGRLDDAIGPYCRSKLLAERHAFRLARAGRRS